MQRPARRSSRKVCCRRSCVYEAARCHHRAASAIEYPDFQAKHPGAADISLVVQISDSNLSFDLGEKLALYRANAIREYWVVDLKATQVHRFAAPHFKSQTFRDSISPSAWPDIRIDLRELLA